MIYRQEKHGQGARATWAAVCYTQTPGSLVTKAWKRRRWLGRLPLYWSFNFWGEWVVFFDVMREESELCSVLKTMF